MGRKNFLGSSNCMYGRGMQNQQTHITYDINPAKFSVSGADAFCESGCYLEPKIR